jgi:hypothetical protein
MFDVLKTLSSLTKPKKSPAKGATDVPVKATPQPKDRKSVV